MAEDKKKKKLRVVGESSPFENVRIDEIDIQKFHEYFLSKKGVQIDANQLVQILYHQVVKLDLRVKELEAK